MSDPRHEVHDDVDARPGRSSIARTPRWVKVFGAIAAIVIVLLIVVMVVGGDDHGPGRHDGEHESSEGAHG